MDSPADLQSLLRVSISDSGEHLNSLVLASSQVVIFGSRSVGLQTATSDFDVFCVGSVEYKFKNRMLDVLVSTEAKIESDEWRQSELANHIACYGIWIRGTPNWVDNIRVGHDAVLRKQRRIKAFLRYLPETWERLADCYKAKYSIKLRREAQRLLLLELGVPIPPTVLLDTLWNTRTEGRRKVLIKLQEACGSDFPIDDLMSAAPFPMASLRRRIDRIGTHPQLDRAIEALSD